MVKHVRWKSVSDIGLMVYLLLVPCLPNATLCDLEQDDSEHNGLEQDDPEQDGLEQDDSGTSIPPQIYQVLVNG